MDSRRVGVAFLASTLVMQRTGVKEIPRRQRLLVPAGTVLIAVVRLQGDSKGRIAMTTGERQIACAALTRVARLPGVLAIQVDFDAVRSQRTFYRALLNEARRSLPDSVPLTITALASWGLGDRWLDGLPIEEAVPMVFRMGADDTRVRRALGQGTDFSPAICRQSVGVALDEPLPYLQPGRRVYLFSRLPWTRQTYQAALARLGDSASVPRGVVHD